MLTMESYIAKVITIAVKYNVDGVKPSVMATYLDYEILDLLIEFIDRHDSFYSYNHSIELEDLEIGHWGYYNHHCDALVVINSSLVQGLCKRLAIGIGENILHQLVSTVLHEHRHCYQHRNHRACWFSCALRTEPFSFPPALSSNCRIPCNPNGSLCIFPGNPYTEGCC